MTQKPICRLSGRHFLGLYGVDAVLPDYFLNDIATHKDGSESLAAFLDIFNHRITTLFFQAWKKYRYPFLFQREGQDDLSCSLLHLIGQGMVNGKFMHPLLDSRILGLFSIFYQRTRTKEGVVSIVRYLLPFADVKSKRVPAAVGHFGEGSQTGESRFAVRQGKCIFGRTDKRLQSFGAY